jgi:hypothetical protein
VPITFSSDLKIGLGLWNSLPATMVVEFLLFAVAVFIYIRTIKPRDKVGSFAFWGLILFLSVIYMANLFSPLPPGIEAVVWSAQAMWLLVAWGYWVDRRREIRLQPQAGST